MLGATVALALSEEAAVELGVMALLALCEAAAVVLAVVVVVAVAVPLADGAITDTTEYVAKPAPVAANGFP